MPKFITNSETERDASLYASVDYEPRLTGKYAMANDFIRLPKRMDVQQLKIMGLILSKLDFRKDNSNADGIVVVECTLSEIIRACGNNPHKYTNYQYYKGIVSSLMKSSYFEGKIDGEDLMGFAVPYAKANPNANRITFRFKLFNEFLPYFQRLASRYTIIELEQAKNFKSRFSYVLYMNLLSWTDSENHEYYRFYTTKQLKEMFGLSKDDYCKKDGSFDRYNFEKKVIKPAVKEINSETTMDVIYTKNKVGRNVKNYQFNFIDRGKDYIYN